MAVIGSGGDDTPGIHLADAVVEGICDIIVHLAVLGYNFR
jgi:hypothetical protein